METVLIIETDSDAIDLLSEVLGSAGYMADAVDDIETARHKVMAAVPKAIVIGPQLGKSTGFLACSLIKKISKAKNTPIVLMYTEREEGQVERHKTLAGKADVYLRKPFTAEEFLAAAAGILDFGGGEEGEIVVEEEDESAAPMTISQVPVVPADAIEEEVIEEEVSVDVGGGKSAELEAEAERLRSEVEKLKSRLAAAERQAKEAAESAPAARSGGDTRQLLELKQLVNKRDNELVDLKETGLQKDKAILDLRGKINEAEMKQLELSDTIADRDREITSLRNQLDAAVADKDVLSKKSDDLSRRLKTTQEDLKKAKDDGEAERSAHAEAIRIKDEDHASAIDTLRGELTAQKDFERDEALEALRRELLAEKESALAEQKQSFEGDLQAQQQRHDTEVYEMQERFRRSSNQLEERLNGEKAQALQELQAKHEGEVADLASQHEAEIEKLRGRIGELEHDVEAANALAQQRLEEIAKLTEDRDDLASKRDMLDAELKASQVAAEQLRLDGEADAEKIRALEKTIEEISGVRDGLRGKLEGDLVRVDKAKQAVQIAIELLNDVEPL